MNSYSPFQNTLDEVERIADFLGLTLAPELLSEIANKCQFKGMKEELNKLNFVEIMCKVNKRYKFMRKGKFYTGQSTFD